eukprot:6490642-Amphidinium_carterae.1
MASAWGLMVLNLLANATSLSFGKDAAKCAVGRGRLSHLPTQRLPPTPEMKHCSDSFKKITPLCKLVTPQASEGDDFYCSPKVLIGQGYAVSTSIRVGKNAKPKCSGIEAFLAG